MRSLGKSKAVLNWDGGNWNGKSRGTAIKKIVRLITLQKQCTFRDKYEVLKLGSVGEY